MDEPEEHIYHALNREESAMNKKRENPYPGLKKYMLKRQEGQREEDNVFTEVSHRTREGKNLKAEKRKLSTAKQYSSYLAQDLLS